MVSSALGAPGLPPSPGSPEVGIAGKLRGSRLIILTWRARILFDPVIFQRAQRHFIGRSFADDLEQLMRVKRNCSGLSAFAGELGPHSDFQSVAASFIDAAVASISTLPRIGTVLRRSTIPCARLSPLNSDVPPDYQFHSPATIPSGILNLIYKSQINQ